MNKIRVVVASLLVVIALLVGCKHPTADTSSNESVSPKTNTQNENSIELPASTVEETLPTNLETEPVPTQEPETTPIPESDPVPETPAVPEPETPVEPEPEPIPETPVAPYYIIDYEDVSQTTDWNDNILEKTITKVTLDNNGILIYNKVKNDQCEKYAKMTLSKDEVCKVENFLKSYKEIIASGEEKKLTLENISVSDVVGSDKNSDGMKCHFYITIAKVTSGVTASEIGKVWEVNPSINFYYSNRGMWFGRGFRAFIDVENETCIKDHLGNQTFWENCNIKLKYDN